MRYCPTGLLRIGRVLKFIVKMFEDEDVSDIMMENLESL